MATFMSVGSKRNSVRLAGVALLSLTMMACGNTPTSPGGAQGAGQPNLRAQMEVCPVEPQTVQGAALTPQECLPPDPDPTPEPDPTPQPTPPVFSVSPDPGKPAITTEMAAALREAGMADPLNIGQTYTMACPVALYTRKSASTSCTMLAPRGTILRSALYPNYQPLRDQVSGHNCSKTVTQLASGGTVQSRTEVDSIYGRAINAALSVGNVKLAGELGQLRDYHLSVINISSDTATVQVTFYAKADSFWKGGRGGNCNGTYWADFIGR